MTDKTCGTCALWMRDPIESDSYGAECGACHVSLFGGKYKLTYGDNECIEQGYYCERDSVDLVVREWAEVSRECDIDPAGWIDRLIDLGAVSYDG